MAAAPLSPPRIRIPSAAVAVSLASSISLTTSPGAAFGASMFDAVLAAGGKAIPNTIAPPMHCDNQPVTLKQIGSTKTDDYHVLLEPSCLLGQAPSLPMGRARHYMPLGATACPATVKPPPAIPRRPYPQLAVVGLVLDPTGEHVLLTRRPSHMRSFPGAWVLPGGGMDYGLDTRLEDALKREVLEETGLKLETASESNKDSPRSPRPICIWESCYPTDPAAPGPITAHHLVVFFRAYVEQTQTTPKLQESEVQCALWLRMDSFREVLKRMRGKEASEESSEESSAPLFIYNANGSTQQSSLDTIVGIYPQPDKENNTDPDNESWCGIGQGSLFALEELLKLSECNHQGTLSTAWDTKTGGFPRPSSSL